MHLLSCSKKTLGAWTRHRTHDSHQMQQISQVKGRPTEREHNLTSLVLLIHFQADRLWNKNFELKKVITTCVYWDVSFFKSGRANFFVHWKSTLNTKHSDHSCWGNRNITTKGDYGPSLKIIYIYITVDNDDRFPFLTLYTVVLIFIFSTLFYLHFLWFWQGKFVWHSGASFKICDHFPYSLYLILRWYWKEKFEVSHSQWLNG